MRVHHVVAATAILLGAATLLGAAAPLTLPRTGQPEVLPVCPSQQTALLASRGGIPPEGCHVVLVRRMETVAGPVCELDFSPNLHGITGAIATAMRVPMQWWISCNYLGI